MTTINVKPYPTMGDKVILFESNGIMISNLYEGGPDPTKPDWQVFVFEGPSDAGAAAKLCKDLGIQIHEHTISWRYNDKNELYGECSSGLVFATNN